MRRRRWGIAAAVLALAVVTVAAIGAADPTRPASSATTSPSGSPAVTPGASASPVYVRVGGVQTLIPDRTIEDPTLLPYPFMSPTPSPTPTELDGTYLRTLTLRELGGARRGLPYRCLRCPPFRIDAGVSTVVLLRGAYYIHHHLSGFRTMGSFVVDGDRVTLFNDANCPQDRGIYEVDVTAHGLRFRVVEDDCSFSGERALDLMVSPWTRVSACIRRIQNLWPGAVAC